MLKYSQNPKVKSALKDEDVNKQEEQESTEEDTND